MTVEKVQLEVRHLEKKRAIDGEAFEAEVMRLATARGVPETDLIVLPAKRFPSGEVIVVVVTFASKIAYDVWREFILPELKERYRVKQAK